MIDASRIERAAGGPIDLAIVLGSGLSSILRDRFEHVSIPYDTMLGFPTAALRGHAGEALIGPWQGKRVAVLAGRVHLYQGFSPHQVTFGVRLMHAAGAKVIVLTNAAGAVNRDFGVGDLMIISDHINLTGRNPLSATPHETPFVDMTDAYSSRLRAIAASVAKPEYRLHEGVYAGMEGPSYETPAEVAYLRTIGADAVGMSTVLETISARFLGMSVFGVSVITNIAGAAGTEHESVAAAGRSAGDRLARLLADFIEKV
jgi:purine-nucleoside phosphorylase